MSYCRWSSMNWMCDVYVYESIYGGWETHVAGGRRIFPPIPDFFLSGKLPSCGGKWDGASHTVVYPNVLCRMAAKIVFGFGAFWHNRVHMRMLEAIPIRKHTLPFAGQSFIDPTPGECAERLEHLRSLGYVVPQYAIDELRAEQANSAEQPNNVVRGGEPSADRRTSPPTGSKVL